MSYNTRRSGGFNPNQPPQQQSASNVGQRRPAVSGNFVPGGQLAPQQQSQQQKSQPQQQRPVGQQSSINFRNQPPPQQQQKAPQQQQRPVTQQQQSGNFRSQQQGQQPQGAQQNYQTQNYSTQPQQQNYQAPVKTEPASPRVPPQQQQQQQQQQQAVKPPQQAKPPQQVKPPQIANVAVAPAPASVNAPVAPTVANIPGANPPPPEKNDMEMDTSGEALSPKKKFWFKGRISKAEKVRRRNMRLSKILQPKNAVMILNELVRGCQYTVEELPCKVDANQFKASVTFEGQEFEGVGRTKNGAKNAAAETALKHLVKNKQLRLKKEEDGEGEGEGEMDGDGDVKMEISEAEDGSQVMPWSHIASFAMYKLFSSWGDDPALANRAQELLGTMPKMPGIPAGTRPDPKPAKKMPDNPEKMNPLMLMNQMLPHAQWEEVGKSGVPPSVVFTFKVTVDDQIFTGTGPNKKTAKKLAAFAACHQVLKIDYPADVWVPLY